MGLLLTTQILARVPNWTTAENWQVGETVDFGNWNNQCTYIGAKILNDDSFASFMNNHPPHHP